MDCGKIALSSVIIFLSVCIAFAEQQVPSRAWQDTPNPIAGRHATQGGEISVFGGQYPQSINYYLDNNSISAELFGAMYESLLGTDPITAEYVPGLAESWSISEDKQTFTFRLDPDARWSDGRPVTAHDVRWTFDALMAPENLTGVHKVALEKFDPPTVVDDRTVRFTATEVHWRNLGAAGGIAVLPKHVFGGQEFNKINFTFPVVSGHYRLGEIKEGVYVKLHRRDDWWRRGRVAMQNIGNFSTLTFRFFSERENAFEAFRKGLIDIYPVYTSRLWVKETHGDRFDRHWIIKQKVHNQKPVGFQGFAVNMRRAPFDDVRVRHALAHLLDRERMNRTIMYGQYFMHRSYYEDLYDAATPCTNPIFGFDKERARALLSEAGWHPDADTGILEKDGQPFVFTFLTRDPSSEKFLAIYGEDLRDVGIRLKIERKDWAAWTKDMDTFSYDMTWASWGAGLFKDPEGMWLSSEADRRGGINITGFKNARVDELIKQQQTLFDVSKRHAICREIDAIVTRECPYILLWNVDYVRLLYWNKFGAPPSVLSKYGGATAAYSYWWYDEDSAADLKDAVQNGLPLPPLPASVNFDAVFGGRDMSEQR
jgi:microcin C transport system substrate-binding protein